MSESNTDTRPRNVITEVWRDYRSWADAARSRKGAQGRSRNITLILGVAGAFLATLSSRCPEFAWISLLGAAAIALAGYFGRELLTPEKETEWARCRMLAEALQRQVWLALMQAPPYQGSDAADQLKIKASELINSTKLTHPAQIAALDKPVPRAESVEDYIKLRVEEQTNYYRRRAGTLQNELSRWRGFSLFLGALAVVMGVVGGKYAGVAVWVPVVTSCVAAVLAVVQAGKYQAQIQLYQLTASQLALTLAHWKDKSESSLIELVQACEEIMSRENDSWRIEWLSSHAPQDKNNPARKPKSSAKTG